MATMEVSHRATGPTFRPRILWLLLAISLSMPAVAQPHMMGGGMMGMGGYMGPVVRFSTVDGSPAAFVGGRAGMAVRLDATSSLTVGGAMYGMMTDTALPESGIGNRPSYLIFNYGGVEIGYQFHPNAPVSFTVSSLLGVGWSDCDDDDGYFDSRDYETSVFVAEPGVGITLHATPFLRIGLEASYRFSGAAAAQDYRDVPLDGASGAITLLIGHHL